MAVARALLVVDANHLLHRVLHVPALSNLNAKNARFTKRETENDVPDELGGVFGFLRSLKASLGKIDAKRCIAVWDGAHSKRRLALFPGYKDRGERTDREREHHALFVKNQPILRGILPLLGVRSIKLARHEADDVIYELCQLAGPLGYPDRVIMSEDMDFAQMVTDQIRLHLPIKNTWIDLSNFERETGVPWKRFVLYRALVGDSSDKIPGVSGVGKKTAPRIVRDAPSIKWAALEEFCANHREARYRHVAEQIDIVKRNYKLMRLGREEFRASELARLSRAIRRPVRSDLNAAREFLDEIKFKSITQYYSDWVIPFIRAGARWGA